MKAQILSWWAQLQDVNFSSPDNWHLAAVVLPLVFLLGSIALWKYRRARRLYGRSELVEKNPYTQSVSTSGEILRVFLRSLVRPGLLILALTGPFLPGALIKVPSGNQDVIVEVSVNRGMGAVDKAPSYSGAAEQPGSGQFFHETGSRLDIARHMIKEGLMPALGRNQLGLIAYQGKAKVIVPLTDAFDTVDRALDPANKNGLHIGSAPYGDAIVNGKVSTIASAIEAALDEFDADGTPGHEKVIVLISNGDDISDEGWLAEEIAKLKAKKVKLVVIAVGGPEIQIPVYTGDDEQFAGYYHFRDGTEALSGVNEGNLSKLAEATGGRYLHLDPANPPKVDFFMQEVTSFKWEVGRWLLFEYAVWACLALTVVPIVWGFLWNLGKNLSSRNRRRK